MKTIEERIAIQNIEVRIVRKKMKTVRLSVSPPDGEVRLSVPQRFPEKDIRSLLEEKLPWIEKKRSEVLAKPPLRLQFLSGEEHYFLGKPYLLQRVDSEDMPSVSLNENQIIMKISPDLSKEFRQLVLDEWYRLQLQQQLPLLTSKWESIVRQQANEYRIKKMKTRWGTCNTVDRRIWLNLELIKQPLECIEYVLVHELVHFYERYHNQNFKKHMDQFMPQWRLYDQHLKRFSLLY